MNLHVYFGKTLIGRIDPLWDFQYTEAWLEQPSACGVSLSLPLQKDALPGKESRNFFANLLGTILEGFEFEREAHIFRSRNDERPNR